MRLINVAPMLEQLDLEHYDKDWYVSQYNADWISSWLESQPVIDAEPVRHGRWEEAPYNGHLRCSVCKDCKSRYPACWGTCEAYIAQKSAHVELRNAAQKKRNADAAVGSVQFHGITKIKKRRNER